MAQAMWKMVERYLMMMRLKILMLRSITKSLGEDRRGKPELQLSLVSKATLGVFWEPCHLRKKRSDMNHLSVFVPNYPNGNNVVLLHVYYCINFNKLYLSHYFILTVSIPKEFSIDRM